MSEQNPFPGEKNTGHFWDEDLRELTNDPPNWWRWGLHLSWMFILGYFILYPTLPTFTTYSTGLMGWTSMNESQEDMDKIDLIRAKYEDRIKDPNVTVAMMLEDDELREYSIRSAKVLFGDNCAACHATGGAGTPGRTVDESGYPVLADDDWLAGGTVEAIERTITNGRKGIMSAYKGRLTEDEIETLVQYVMALGEGTADANEEGVELFNNPQKGGCFICHGADGKGKPTMGSANLTDSVWRFAPGGLESARHTIEHGVNVSGNPETRNAVMPAFGPNGKDLGAGNIKKLAVYVHQLGGGQ